MYSIQLLVQVTLLFTICNAIPIFQSVDDDDDDDENGMARSNYLNDEIRKQLIFPEPHVYHDLPPHSEGVFDSFGHHLTG